MTVTVNFNTGSARARRPLNLKFPEVQQFSTQRKFIRVRAAHFKFVDLSWEGVASESNEKQSELQVPGRL